MPTTKQKIYAIATMQNPDGTYDEVGMNNRRPITSCTTEAGVIRNINMSKLFGNNPYKVDYYVNKHSSKPYKTVYRNKRLETATVVQGPLCTKCQKEMKPHDMVQFHINQHNKPHTMTCVEAIRFTDSMRHVECPKQENQQ